MPRDATIAEWWRRLPSGFVMSAKAAWVLLTPGGWGSSTTPTPAAQYTSIRYADRLADAGAFALIGTVGDPCDSAQTESLIGRYNLECVRHEGPRRGIDDLELATLDCVHWFNAHRLHCALGDAPPIEFQLANIVRSPPDTNGCRES